MHVLIGVDGSEARRHIVDEIKARSWGKESRFEVLNVAQPPHMWELGATAEQAKRGSAAEVAETVAALRDHGLIAEGVQRQGDPRTVVCDYAKEVRAELIVVGSYGESGVASFLVGSVSGAVLHRAPCSVWIVRPPRRSGSTLKILLATDGSECSEQAALSISKRSWPAGTEVRVLSAVDTFPEPEVGLLDSQRLLEIQSAARAVAEHAVDAATRIVQNCGVSTSGSICAQIAPPKKVIVDEAKSWGADWIVMGSHGRRGLSYFLLGSVSEAVATHAPCSVEVVRVS